VYQESGMLLGEFTFWDFVGEEELEAEPEPEIRFFLFETPKYKSRMVRIILEGHVRICPREL
jgi:hypothetical protein